MGKLARRIYECAECKQRVVITTNHEWECYPACKGTCVHMPHRQSSAAPAPRATTHIFIEPWDGVKAPNLIIVD